MINFNEELFTIKVRWMRIVFSLIGILIFATVYAAFLPLTLYNIEVFWRMLIIAATIGAVYFITISMAIIFNIYSYLDIQIKLTTLYIEKNGRYPYNKKELYSVIPINKIKVKEKVIDEFEDIINKEVKEETEISAEPQKTINVDSQKRVNKRIIK